MKVYLALGLIALLLVVACGKATPADTTGDVTPTMEENVAPTTEESINNVTGELNELDTLEEDLNFSELDALDEELNFG